MPLTREKQSIGLDLGQSSAKLVQVALRGKAVQVVRTAVFDARREGLLDEAEMFAGTASWLKELGLVDRDVCIGLPQHLATTQVSDFPPHAKGDELSGMVGFETVQLAGLSDEAFASDYQVMAPEFGRKNPVLIGICRQAAVDERNHAFAQAGVRVCEVAMEGLGAINALLYLRPEVRAEKGPQMVLDLGAEGSTLLVLAAGQVLYAGTLLFGAVRFEKALAVLAAGGGGAQTAAAGAADSPLLAAHRQLEGEIRNSIEHWRAGERQEIAGKAVVKIWVCGGGAKIEGIAESLGRAYGCPGEVFGPRAAGGQPDPQSAVALGLALQGLGTAGIAISLCPEPIAWARARKQRFGYLAAAAVILVSLTVFYLVRQSRELERRTRDMADQIGNLDKCKALIPKLEENAQLIQHHEKMLLPVIEKGNRAGRFLTGIAKLAAAQGEGDWFIYLADELSFDEGKPKDEKPGSAAAPERAAAAPTMAFPGTLYSLDSAEAAPAPLQAVLVASIEQLRSMVMAGHSPKSGRDVLEPVKAIRARLNQSGLFKDADLLPKPERVGREEDIFQPWALYLQGLAERRITGQYVPYMFRLPFAALDINKPAPAPARAPARPASQPSPPSASTSDDKEKGEE
jgi:Tfp pilus assembly PilM family ATPase